MKDKKRLYGWKLCTLMAFGLPVLFGLSGCAQDGYNVQVLLTENDGYTITSENPMTVRAGEDATFSVTLDEGYTFVQALDGDMQDVGAVWSDGTLTIPAVRTPVTVNLTALEEGETVKFFLENGTGGGWIGKNTEDFSFLPGTPVHLTAIPHEGYYFAGWTLGKSMDAGGALLSADADFVYTVEKRGDVYGNFYLIEPEEEEKQTSNEVDNLAGPTKNYGEWGMQGNESTHMIQYDANGGTVVGYDSTVYYDLVSTAVYSCPNTLADKGYFAKEGYVLLEYNTKADGSGTAIPCGGKFAPDGESTTLYCIWAEYSDPNDFTYTDTGKGLTVTGYSGNDDMLVIPEKVGSQNVTRVAAGAFQDGSFTTVVIPKTVEAVENGAFVNCKKLETVYLFDSIKQIYDDAFRNTDWKKLHLGAVRDPVFSNHEDATFARKWEKLLVDSLTDTKNLVVCSGSSSYYGLDTPLLEELLDNEYSVINFGNVATCNVNFFMDGVADYLDENDILVQAPEVYYGGEMGDPYFYWVIYRIIEHSYDFLYHVDDLSLYNNVLGGLTEFNGYREYMTPLSYDIYCTKVDENGDITLTMPNGSKNAFFGVTISYQNVNTDWLANLTTMHERIMEETGCRVYFSFAPFNYNAVESSSRTEKVWDKFMETVRENLHVPVISYIWDYKMDGYLMYNSDYHTAEEGRGIRTRQLAEDILAQFAKEAAE